jgi:hypothetical protein
VKHPNPPTSVVTSDHRDQPANGSHVAREPTTYSALAKHPNAINVPPDLTVPPLPPTSPWHHDPVPKEEPSDVGSLCGEVLGVALGGASPSKREEPAK